MDVEFKRQYFSTVLGDLPTNWTFYTETVTDDHWPVMILGYSESYVWLGFETVEERVQQIVTEFIRYLNTRDRTGLAAIMMLSDN